MEIPPVKADLTQITRARGGKMVAIENDVQGVANALHELDPHLRLRFSEAGEYFVVYWKPDDEPEGNGELVTTAQELDHRIVQEVKRCYWKASQPGYSFADELDEVQKAKQAEADRQFTEDRGDMYERLAHAMRKDLGYDKGRITVPGVPDDAA